MDLPSIPTDKLYKTLAIGGLVICFLAGYLMWVVRDKENTFFKEHLDEYSGFIEQRSTINPQFDRLKFDLNLQKGIIKRCFHLDYDSIRENSNQVNQILIDRIENNITNELRKANYLNYKIDSLKAKLDFINAMIKTEEPTRELFSSSVSVDIVLMILMIIGAFTSLFGFNKWFKKEK